MNSKTTWRLFLLAVAAFAFIYFVERRVPDSGPSGKSRVFARITPAAVTGIEVHSSNQVIRAELSSTLGS